MGEFVCTWSVNDGDTVALPIQIGIDLNSIIVDWDGAVVEYPARPITTADDRPKHTYTGVGGIKTIKVNGRLPGWSFYLVPNKNIVSIVSYGQLELHPGITLNGSLYNPIFRECPRLESLPANGNKLRLPSNCVSMFGDCDRLGITGNSGVETLDTSNVTTMQSMFGGNAGGNVAFNGNVTGWNVSQVTDMSQMFIECRRFTGGDLSKWDVSNVTNMRRMFENCHVFNGDISTWNVSKVQNMDGMFDSSWLFTIDISKWVLTGIQGDAFLPKLETAGVFAGTYLLVVKPKFSTGYRNAWKFNKPVTKNAINIILGGLPDRDLYYMDDNLRLRLATDRSNDTKSYTSAILRGYNSSIANIYNKMN
jgi:surface protein